MGLESNCLGSNNAYILPSSTTFNKFINLSLSQFSYCKMGCMHAKSLQSRLFATLWAIARPPGSSVHGILQARILEWVAISSSRGLPHPGIKPESLTSPALTGRFLPLVPPGKPQNRMMMILMLLSQGC